MATDHPTMAHITRRMSSIHKETKPHEKHPKFGNLPLSTSGPQDCALTGTALLNTPYLNKGAGFPPEERKTFKLTGLLPQNVQTLDQQVKRAYQQYSTRVDDLAKNTFMTSLGEQNEVLYYRVSFISPEAINLFALLSGEFTGHAISFVCSMCPSMVGKTHVIILGHVV
jgi:malate dehydrogenase (oxaloacetate-decarboxylating)